MKVTDGSVRMASHRYAEKKEEKRLNVRAWVDPPVPQSTPNNVISESSALAATVSLSGEGVGKSSVYQAAMDRLNKLTPLEELKYLILKAVFERLTGKKFAITDASELSNDVEGIEIRSEVQRDSAVQGVAASSTERVGWGVQMDSYSSYSETESMSFSADGTINTADGKEISFQVSINMSRSFFMEHSETIRLGDANLQDPLVINFKGSGAALTERKFSFDIDSDGGAEQISFVRPGSGFLALDRNGNGKIDNGGELFGPKSGDSFGELAKLDSDNNGWIDSNDSIFEKLRIWSRDESGKEKLVALGKSGVGAIYLGSLGTLFDMKDTANELQGRLKSTGIFVGDDGVAGTVQQLDLRT